MASFFFLLCFSQKLHYRPISVAALCSFWFGSTLLLKVFRQPFESCVLGDRQTRWQALEGLGCVKFNQGKYDKAESFFLDALRLIPESAIEVSERVKQKLAQVMEMKFMSARHQSARYGHSLRPQSNMSRTMGSERLQNLEVTFWHVGYVECTWGRVIYFWRQFNIRFLCFSIRSIFCRCHTMAILMRIYNIVLLGQHIIH